MHTTYDIKKNLNRLVANSKYFVLILMLSWLTTFSLPTCTGLWYADSPKSFAGGISPVPCLCEAYWGYMQPPQMGISSIMVAHYLGYLNTI